MAAVVDTTGNFDVVKLYTDILERMRKVPELIEELQAVTDSKEGDTTEDVAAKVLDQVKIMRVFDFVGVREAIGEIRDDLEGKRSANRKRQTAEGKPEAVKRLLTPKRPTPEPLTPEPLPKRTVVADSEDEDDEEEMLFDTVELVEEVLPVPPIPSLQPEADTAEAREVQEFQDEETSSKVRFILIDNLAQALNPLLKKDYIQGSSDRNPKTRHFLILMCTANALASIFLQALNHLTRTHALHTILANPATPPRPTSSPTRQPPNQGPLPPEHTKQQPPPPPSIFASNGLVPSLKGVLARYVDVSLLVSQLPKKKKDAKVYYHDENAGATKKLRGVEMVSVLEIISDRWESRVGAWASL